MKSNLKKGINLPAVIALGLGTAVGVSIFSALGPATAIAGPGMLITVVLAALPVLIMSISYAFMGSAAPTSGATYEWSRRFLHPYLGFILAWIRVISAIGALMVLALVLVRYVSMLIEIPVKPTMFCLFAILATIHHFGVDLVAKIQTVLMSLLVVAFVIFAALGAPSIDAANFSPLLAHGWYGIITAIPLLLGLFAGLESACEVGDEVADGRRQIPIGIAVATISALLLYLMIGAVSLGVLGADGLANSKAPLLDTARQFAGPAAVPMIVAMAVIAMGKSLNAIFMIFSRSIFAMARANALPEALAKIHPRWGTPYLATRLVFALCCIGLLLPMDLTFLFIAVNIVGVIQSAAICYIAGHVVRRHPDLYDGASFKFGRTTMIVFSWAGVGVAVILGAIGLETDWKPYLLLVSWGSVGTVFYLARQRRKIAPAVA
ncbi:APC family permease [Roseiterribacter gracilis]|uniref:Amino acid transporter n=1 Tax=Roseiterribacter gracilis TaxID=2812848 RepID=A0A8S8XI99_9PROT|nr:amino acid transporter [Rhodospirillales bacterium TMPK1]